MEFETLGSKIAKGIMKIIPADFKRKKSFLQDQLHQNQAPMFTSRHIVCQILSFFRINKTRGYTMSLRDVMKTSKGSVRHGKKSC